MSLSKGLCVGAVAVVVTVSLSGCVVFQTPPTGKQVRSGDVRVTFTVCASGPENGSCPDEGNSGEEADEGRVNQLLLGLRAPRGSKLPDKIHPVEVDAEEQVEGRLLRFRSYTQRLNQEAPRRDGFRWFGYESEPVETAPEDTARFKVNIGLPRGFDARRFKVRPVVGYFEPDAEHPANSPIVCGEALYDRVSDEDGDRACIDSPTPDEVERSIRIPVD